VSTLITLNRAIVSCARCPRLRAYCRRVARDKKREFRDWTYWGRPVPGFGDPNARLLVVGYTRRCTGKASRIGLVPSRATTG
jgi:uracil-DNA glycosylase